MDRYEALQKQKYDNLFTNPQFWSIVCIFILITLHQYDNLTSFRVISFPDLPLGITRHTIDRILYLVPIILSSLIFGSRGGIVTVVAAFLAMLPRSLFITQYPLMAFWETLVITLIGSLAPLGLEQYKKQKEQLEVTKERLETTQKELHTTAKLSKERERQLAVINAFSVMLSQSLELQQVVNMTIDMVMGLIDAEVVLVFSLDEKSERLDLIAFRGIREETAKALNGMKLGEGLCGRVASTGEPILINDIESDPELCSLPIIEERLKTELSVPLMALSKIVGTICVASRTRYRFKEPEIMLLSALGNMAGIAMENSRLYKEKERASENQSFYLQQITRAHEDERQRISRDLHDSTAQTLIGTLRRLEKFCEEDKQLSPERLELLWGFHGQLKEALTEIRQLSRDLRPSILDHLGLLPAVEWLIEQLRDEDHVRARLRIIGDVKRFSPEIEVALFRIVQESLRNISKHANATNAEVVIDFRDNETMVTISDDGNGFVLPASTGELSRIGKLGVDGMQTRARLADGAFTIQSYPGSGTTICVTVPA